MVAVIVAIARLNSATAATGGSEMAHVAEEDIETIERRFPEGVTSAQVIAFFQDRGVRLSEATFRRYVQLDLLPRCRRVGRLGRHRGSEGIYPIGVVRRLNEVKRHLDEDFSVEDMRRMFRVSEDDFQAVKAAVGRVAAAAGDEVAGRPDAVLARQVAEMLEAAGRLETKMREVAAHLVRRCERGRLAV